MFDGYTLAEAYLLSNGPSCEKFTYGIQVTLCVIFGEIFIHFLFQRSINPLYNSSLYIGIVGRMKMYTQIF
jgi:hypothetical protein